MYLQKTLQQRDIPLSYSVFWGLGQHEAFFLFVSLFKHSIELTQILITSGSGKYFSRFLLASNIYKTSRKCKHDLTIQLPGKSRL